MNIELLRKSGWIIYETIVGSHLYGTNKEGSDTDIRGIYIQPTEQILANGYIEQISDSTNDTTFYEIGRFLQLACNANPNILELLHREDKYIIYKDPIWDSYVSNYDIFLTKELQKTFLGYAYSQIQKAKGLNKKVNWDKAKMVRKTPLDFCYLVEDHKKEKHNNREASVKIQQAYNGDLYHDYNLGLASVNNFPDVYSVYFIGEGGGIINENSNDVQTRSIPKGSTFLGYMRFDRNAYSTHCKDYREYTQWLEKRNPLRYADNAKVDNEYDTKNLSHCVRLLLTAKDIALGNGLILRRKERDYLLDIRNGKVSYEEILDTSTKLMDEVKELFDKSTLPKNVNRKQINKLLLQIRLDDLKL